MILLFIIVSPISYAWDLIKFSTYLYHIIYNYILQYIIHS